MMVKIDAKYLVAAIVIIAVNVFLRTGMLKFNGFFEPDGFFYYTALTQAVQNSFQIYPTVLLSGYPTHNPFGENHGLLYVTLTPYLLLGQLGVSLYNTMRLVPMAFGLLNALGIYLILKVISKSDALGLLGAAFISVLSGDIARTAGGVYRGDSFITFFILVSLYLLIRITSIDAEKRQTWLLVAYVLTLFAGNVLWTGGVIISGINLLAIGAIIAYAYASDNAPMLKKVFYLLGGTIVAFLLINIAITFNIMKNNVLSGADFFIIFIPLTVFCAITLSLSDKTLNAKIAKTIGKESIALGTTKDRLLVLAAVILIIAVPTILLFGSHVANVITDQGLIGTISFLNHNADNNIAITTQEIQPVTYSFLWASFGYGLLLAPIGLLLLLLFGDRLFEMSKIKIANKIPITISAPSIVLIVYMAVMAYMQAGQIRFNALFAPAIALASAIGIYIAAKIIGERHMGIGKNNIPIKYFYFGIITVILIMQFFFTSQQSAGSAQADGINQLFLDAMTWMRLNTPANATVLALWPDGSVVEGWAHRTSFIDSVGGENATRIEQFHQFLLSNSTKSNYLTKTAFEPQYLVVRNFWFQELAGIAIEANITQNLTSYGYEPMLNYKLLQQNNSRIYDFSDSQYEVRVAISNDNGINSAGAFLMPVNDVSLMRPIRYIIFMNTSNYDYSIVNSSANNNTLNYGILLSYNGSQIQGAAIIGPNLVKSNLFKLLVECSYTQCAYGDSNVTARVVYANYDSKIIRLTYS